jgi:hypothetical protein
MLETIESCDASASLRKREISLVPSPPPTALPFTSGFGRMSVRFRDAVLRP